MRPASLVSRGLALLVCVGALACSSGSTSKTSPKEPAPDGKRFTLFVTTELRGTTEPCGCTSDPLGDLARTARLIADARGPSSPVLYIDGGSMLFSELHPPEHLKTQEQLKADLLRKAFADSLQAAAVGIGPYDLAFGAAAVQPARHAANLPADAGVALAAPEVIEIGGTSVGIFGVVAPEALAPLGVNASDPVAAAKAAVADLEKKGARVIVGLAHMDKKNVADLAKAVPGIDILVVGQNAPEPDGVSDTADKVGDTWLVQPANRGQVVTRLDVTIRDGDGPLVDAIGKAAAEARVAALADRVAKLDEDLARWRADDSADPAFLTAKEQELAAVKKEKAALEAEPLVVPESGSWFVLDQIEIKKRLPCDAQVQAAKVAFDKAAGAANVAAAKGQEPPPPPPGKAGYVGAEECSYCHDEAYEFWKKTRHHQAWETLEKYGKQYNFDCIYCHVTGWDEPGGSNLGYNEPLRDVQCETCHGPGSLHVESEGNEETKTVQLIPPETLCVTCHSPEHSDTFDYQAYLRDVTGPGHGEAFRKRLGDGPTGRELRQAALEKAGKSLGAGCLK